MMRLILALMVLARAAVAETPVVVTDIAPVHGLVARVMVGVGEPALLLPPGTSPHGYALRPSQARSLQQADLVVQVGPELTPWLDKPLSSLAGQARVLELLEVIPDLALGYDGHADEHGEEAHGDGHTDEHSEEAHDDGHSDEHSEEAHEGDHHHEGVNPHAWLDPRVALRWTSAIAEALIEADPANSDRYRANAADAEAELRALDRALQTRLAPLHDRAYVTFHDAYGYLERRYDLTNAGALRTGDATAPGAARLAALSAEVEASGAVCAFAEPQFDPSLLRAAGEKGNVKLAVLDPLGVGLEPGPGFYPALMEQVADALTGCLGR